MPCRDLREFIAKLEKKGELRRVSQPVSPKLEMTALADRTLKKQGPALLFENVKDENRTYTLPVLANLFGTVQRVELGIHLAQETQEHTPLQPALETSKLRTIGSIFAALKEPKPPAGLRDLWNTIPLLRKALTMAPKEVRSPPCQANIQEDQAVDLHALPVQTCWPEDAAPLITWGLVITQSPAPLTAPSRLNLGIYRQQVLSKNKVILRWLAHRGGALDFQRHQQANPGQPFPVSVVIGADPATLLAAVTPIPDGLSEYQFAGLLRGERTELARCIGSSLRVPSHAEIVLEGTIQPDPHGQTTAMHAQTLGWRGALPAQAHNGWEMALEGPFGDHTGYYNEQEWFPVLTVDRITQRANAIYHSTYTGKPPDEPAILGAALNELFIPILQKQFPEITDFYLPPEGCSYRLAVVSIRKQYLGHAKRIFFGIWGVLRQFLYTKFVIVTDEDIDIRDWQSVIWAITTRVDPQRDITLISNTPIDYLDFSSPTSGLGSKMGVDATNKWLGETQRAWGHPIKMPPTLQQKIDALCKELGL